MAESKLSKIQENKLSTFVDIDQVLERFSEIISGIPAFADTVANYRAILQTIRDHAVERGTVLKGKTFAKSSTRIELENATVVASSVLFAFGSKTGDPVVTKIAEITPSSLDRLRDTEVLNSAVALQRVIVGKIPELAAYGFSQQDYDSFSQWITKFESSSNEKSYSATHKKYLTKSLGELFQEVTDVLYNEIDMFVNSLKTKEKAFYDSYYAVRSVKNLGIRHKKLPEGIQQQQNA